MAVIYKYLIEPGYPTKITMPKGAEILTVHTQGDDAFLWAEVPGGPSLTEDRYFDVIPTGVEFHTESVEDRLFIGTIFFNNGLVFHIYERMNLIFV